jgi:hypothetical protein
MKKLFLMAALSLAACTTDNTQQQAAQLLEEAQTQFEQKQYTAAMATIDTLRHRYPKAIDARRKALTLYQDAEIAQAQDELEETDSALQHASKTYDQLKAAAERAHANGTATASQLTEVTRTRMLRDSLQVQFDLQCAKIKYIRKKQKEN